MTSFFDQVYRYTLQVDTWFGGARWWHCGLASSNRTLHLMTKSAQTKKKP